ncbi:FAD-dependent oxidoreductase [Alphaproteobacteria bacterium]|nr:FAD-dependent oxidoreductase [Alphaproteobacteria bacterium]
MSVDVIVIGGGFAGLTAANRCAEHGLKAVVLEAGSDALYWCNSRITTGALHINFRNPLEPADGLFDAIMETTDGTARQDLARTLTSRASATIDWMKAEGAAFVEHPRRSTGVKMLAPLRKMRAALDWERSGPNLFLQILEGSLLRRGGELRRGCRATTIERKDSQITGVTHEGPAGTGFVACLAVVIADGGFQGNPALVGRHITPRAADLQRRNAGTGRGDGLRMATEIGAASVGLDTFYGHVLSRDAMENDQLWPYPQVDLICAQSLVVDRAGRRFADEGQGGIYMANAIARLNKPLSATAVFDAAVWDDALTTDNVPPNPSLVEAGGTVIEADDLATLAGRAGIDPDGLAATVAGYNDFVHAGGSVPIEPERTTDRNKAFPVTSSPYYAIPVCAGITVTSGGLAVNGQGKVVDKDDCPIAGLYAAGSAVGGIEGGPRAGYVGGLIKSFGIGLIAADSIAESLGAAR